jgi:CRISPR/Cas system type I-B associated protein Csh2 (Cas7 group RAMP superfamily)
MENKMDVKQLRDDLDNLSDEEFKAKYSVDAKKLRSFRVEELEKRIIKTSGGGWHLML